MTKKVVELDAEFVQYKAESSERFERIEGAIEALRIESENRHAELMKLMLQQSQKTPPAPPSAPPPTAVTSVPIAPSITAASCFTAAPSFSHGTPPVNRQASNLIFDEHGCPLPPFSEENSIHQGPFRRYAGYEHPSFMSAYDFPPFGSTGNFSFINPGGPPINNSYGKGSGPSGEKIWVPGNDYRLRKLKMPLFEGDDAYGWVYRIERFFDIQGFVTTGEKLRAAVLCMEGQALAWYRWSDGRNPFSHWEDLKGRLLDRFQPSQEGDIYEQFLAVKQEGTAREYVGVFEALAAQLVGVPEKVMEGTFLNGLEHELRTSVRLLQPTGLNQAIKLALMVDESRSGSLGELEKGSIKGPPIRTGGGGSRPLTTPTAGGARSGTGGAEQPFKLMTDTEYAEKRAKGLCFRCDGRFTPGHRCPEKTLQVLIIPDDEDEEEATGASP